MQDQVTRPAQERSGARAPDRVDAFLWIGLALASAPTLADLARHVRAEPWAAYCVVFWALLAAEILRRRERGRRRALGMTLVAGSFLLQYAMHAAGWPRVARPAVALGCVGLALARGHPALRMACLALWLVPLPHFLVEIGSPGLESGLLVAAVRIWNLAGAAIRIDATVASGPAGPLALQAADGGLPLAALLAGWSWYRCALRSDRPGATSRRILTAAACALPIQLVAVGIGLGAVAAGAPRAARAFLTQGPWMLCSALALLWRVRARRIAIARPDRTACGL